MNTIMNHNIPSDHDKAWQIMTVNEMLEDNITKLDSSLTPKKFEREVGSARKVQASLAMQIDRLGEMSMLAQGLKHPITTAAKLKNSQDCIYLIKDANAHSGKGEIIGLLRMGRKHLYLYDEQSSCMREFEPTCVLDFYVMTDYQRQGYGRALFDYMLADLQTSMHKLAVDGPSSKMAAFLAKNYGVSRLQKHHNFAVSPDFFQTNSCDVSSKVGSASTPSSRPMSPRFSHHSKNKLSVASIIHGDTTPMSLSGRNIVASGVAGNSSMATSSVGASNSAASGVTSRNTPESVASSETMEEKRASECAPPQRPTTLLVEVSTAPRQSSERAVSEQAASSATPRTPAGVTSSRRNSQLNDKGYFDIKFYHNKIW